MRLLFSFQKPYQPNKIINYPVNQNPSQDNYPKQINDLPTPIISLGSIFERIKNPGNCNSCSGAR
jgi:hypothetical protein